MIILLDVDGVAANFVDPMLKACAPSKTAADVTSWDLTQCLTETEYGRARGLMCSAGFWRELPVIHGARESVAQMLESGAEVVFVTSPYWSCDTWLHERKRWLERKLGVSRPKVIAAHDKHLVRGDVFIDDKADNVLSWSRAWYPHGRGFVFDQPWNQSANRFGLRLMSWGPEAVEFILSRGLV